MHISKMTKIVRHCSTKSLLQFQHFLYLYNFKLHKAKSSCHVLKLSYPLTALSGLVRLFLFSVFTV